MGLMTTKSKDFDFFLRFKNFWSRKTNSFTQQSSPKKCSKANPLLVDTKKRAKIDLLLNDLAQRDALINAGKMQFLNFFDVKSHMGTKWKFVEPIIIGITLDVIDKYTDETDISFRYSEDEFIIIFARASPEEGQLKCQLITAEIQRLLFEETKTNEKLKGIKINSSHIGISASKLVKTADPLKALDENFKENTQKLIDGNFKKHTITAPKNPTNSADIQKKHPCQTMSL